MGYPLYIKVIVIVIRKPNINNVLPGIACSVSELVEKDPWVEPELELELADEPNTELKRSPAPLL